MSYIDATITLNTELDQFIPSSSIQEINESNSLNRENINQMLKHLLHKVETPLHIEKRDDLAPLVHWSGIDKAPIHRWFRYREGYSPKLINSLNLGSKILDPFCGCGSIMIGAAQLGRNSLGIDINPLAVFITNVKINPLTEKQYKKVSEFRSIFSNLVDHVDCWPIPSLQIANKVFEPTILETVLKIRKVIDEYSLDDIKLKNYLLLGWLSILEDVGNYYKEGNGIKYRNKKRLKTGYITRPNGIWQLERFGIDQKNFVYEKYKDQLEIMLSDSSIWKSGTWENQQVIQGNSLDMLSSIGNEKFDSIIFSPPYANRFDYFESMKVELWYGGFVKKYSDLLELRKNSLRSHLGADLSKPSLNNPQLESFISLMDKESSSWRMRVPTALRGYFDDMFVVLKHCRNLLNKGSSCYIVVGNSAFAGVIIPTDCLIAHLGLLAGFSSVNLKIARHLTVAPQQRANLIGLEHYMRESIIELKY